MESCVVVCRSKKPNERRNKIQLINAVDEVKRDRTQSTLEKEHIDKILKTYLNFEEIEGFSKIVDTDEVLKNDAKLSIPLYVKPKKDESEKKPLKEWN